MCENSVPVWGAESAFRRAVAAAADGGGAWAARTASGPVRMRGDIFAAARRWRGRALPTGNLASRAARRRGAGAVGGAAAAGQGAAWTPLGLRSGGGLTVSVLTPRASAVVGVAATGQANGASDGEGDVVVIPRSWMATVGVRVDPRTDGGTAALGRVSSSSSAST